MKLKYFWLYGSIVNKKANRICSIGLVKIGWLIGVI